MLFTIFALAAAAQLTAPPAPTERATLHELHKRYWTSICGYGRSTPAYSFVCDPGAVCAFVQDVSAFGCCGTVSNDNVYACSTPTACFDSGRGSSTGGNDYSCSNSNFPYCATIYRNNYSNFDCHVSRGRTEYMDFVPNATAVSTANTLYLNSHPPAASETNNGVYIPGASSANATSEVPSTSVASTSSPSATAASSGMSLRVDQWLYGFVVFGLMLV